MVKTLLDGFERQRPLSNGLLGSGNLAVSLILLSLELIEAERVGEVGLTVLLCPLLQP
ncbi:hypothetical protein [Umezawaea sp.]|uniref:hypothetical protein n=1 Tax=Umezawaea sp. TaxID=1955258 RepID=UPI002ED3B705